MSNVNTGDPDPFYSNRPPPYHGPQPIQPPPVCNSSFQSNMPGKSEATGAFWPGQNPSQYLPPPHQTTTRGQRFPQSQEWTLPPPVSVPGYDGKPYDFRPHFPQPPPRFEGYGPPHMSSGYFDPSIPPPPLNPSELSKFSTMSSQPVPVHNHSRLDPSMYEGGPPNPWAQSYNPGNAQSNLGASDFQRSFDHIPPHRMLGQSPQSQYGNPDSNFRPKPADSGYSEHHSRPLLASPSLAPLGKEAQRNQGFSKPMAPQPPDEDFIQRMQDEQWLKRFLRNRKKTTAKPVQPLSKQGQPKFSVGCMRNTLYNAVQLVSKLSMACETLKQNLENDSVWADSYTEALSVKTDLQEKLKVLSDTDCIEHLKKKLSSISKKRARLRRRKVEQAEERQREEERLAEREAAIDKWRMKRIHEVEEKKREQELKVAADTVLCEVRKKQADSKRMLDILKSLEKLRKLRKEAASRKGIFPEQEADQAFDQLVERLRALIRKRTGVYGAEENALRVMLENEQEEERKRDLEKQQKKEKERLLLRKREMDRMLFGDEMPQGHPLQAFLEYYTQAEGSLTALIQIRREWDQYLVPVDHPDGTAIPQDWVIPEPPTDEVWATALDQGDSFGS
ncbi:programmed cell death protein 7 [Esox lucius]|uniref:programmed cell death protein 7 n=1 Tax=Esox lucius TaxID=8010 RepID=UPI0014773854|nr:programmed cell death protein 7 [Esox lucius]